MKRLFIVALFLIIASSIFFVAPNYQVTTFYEKNEIRIVLDDKEITKDIPHPVLIVDDSIMLSSDTIDIYFDKWLYYDEKYDTYVTTTSEHVAKMKVDSNVIEVDGSEKEMKTPLKFVDDVVYMPIEELKEIYNIDIQLYDNKVVITNENPEMQTVTIENKNIKLRALKTFWSRKTATIKIGEKLDVYRYSNDKEWIWARTEDGKLGYVSVNAISPYLLENYSEMPKKIEKINLVWEYAESYTPNREEQSKLGCIDVLAPTWIYLKDENGNLRNTIDRSYISWAHSKGYKIWAVLKNDRMGITKTSQVVTDMNARENLISQLVAICNEYNLDGINIDFEEMKKEDADEFSQFVREVSSTLRKNGYKVSVDVTVPDGSDTWSLCYNRYELSEAVDYMILMAYDQYGASSKKAGSVAAYSWVETNLKKMIERDGIDSGKIVLGIPLYSRKWEVRNGKVSSTAVVTMKYLDKYINSSNTTWLEEEKQYYYENVNGNNYTVMWMDEKESIAQKLSLIDEYDLGGSAFWMFGYENETFWNDIAEFIKY